MLQMAEMQFDAMVEPKFTVHPTPFTNLFTVNPTR